MITKRPAHERGFADHGWLKTHHSFSFADYHDPLHMGFGPLRVINDDWIAPDHGFGRHPHRNMEIITYVMEGALAHQDSMGHGETIEAHDVQRMSAGTGVFHSEFNPSTTAATHLLQIWIEPNALEVTPGYEQVSIPPANKSGRLLLIAGPDSAPVTIHSSTRVYAGLLHIGDTLTHTLAPGRLAYVHLAQGSLEVNGHSLVAGDALKFEQESAIELSNGQNADVLVFDLPRTRRA
jgi:redox-sensitive bicupin YhaK (pirin superfamily)